MIVRLKEKKEFDGKEWDKFQFYDSPIKSHPLVREILARYGFQFYDSPIKSVGKKQYVEKVHKFQFYDSPIKSCSLVLALYSSNSCFNSMIVRLKDKASEEVYMSILVSIL